MILSKREKIRYILALSLFVISAIYGLLIRWNFVFPIALFEYKNILQSHSHVAFLGWGYIVTITAVTQLYLTEKQRNHKIYNITFLILLITVLLMLFSFPIGGYKVFSIVLLSLFGISTYVLSFKLLKDLNGNSWSLKFIKSGIYYYILSSFATWFLASVLITQGKTNLYYNTVYFYLHFLYNGFFVFSLFGLLFKIFEKQLISLNQKYLNLFFVYLNAACIPAYALSVLWSDVSSVFYVIGFAAACLQLISLFFLFKILNEVLSKSKWNAISILLLKFSTIAFSLKITMQFFSSFPYFVQKSLALKPFFIIGYLHLFTLGFMSVFLILILHQLNQIRFETTISKAGILMFLGSVIFTEILFFSQGFLILSKLKPIENYNLLLFIFSSLIVLGLILIFVNQFQTSKKRLH